MTNNNTYVDLLKLIGNNDTASNNNSNLMIGKVTREYPNIEIQVNTLTLEQDDFLINPDLLNNTNHTIVDYEVITTCPGPGCSPSSTIKPKTDNNILEEGTNVLIAVVNDTYLVLNTLIKLQ